MTSSEQLDLFSALNASGTLTELMTSSEIFDYIDANNVGRFTEDRRVEFKSDRLHFDKLAKYFSMFSNTAPEGGVICFGVDNEGVPTGCRELSSDQINAIEKLHLQKCPGAKPSFKRVGFRDSDGPNFFIVIYVPYSGRLVETNKQEAFIRYGDSIHQMSPEEKQDFRATRSEIQFELEPCNLRWPDDFEADIIDSIVRNFESREDIYNRTWEEILEIKHLGIRSKSGFTPNKALALLAARDPRQIIPGARIRIQRFSGSEEGQGASYNPIIDRFIEGNIVRIIERASSLIDNVIYDYTWLNDDGKFVNTKEYPREAWFEALVNALVHRSYVFSGSDVVVKLFEDRMEIESPGGFCPPVNSDNIYEVRASRNPFLMDAMYLLDYVKMAREGTRRMKESMASLGLPAPRFSQEAIHGLVVRVVLRNHSRYRQRAGATDVVNAIGGSIWADLDEKTKKVLELVVRNGGINVSETQQALNISWPSAKKLLIKLTSDGFLTHVHNASDRDTRARFVLNNGKR